MIPVCVTITISYFDIVNTSDNFNKNIFNLNAHHVLSLFLFSVTCFSSDFTSQVPCFFPELIEDLYELLFLSFSFLFPLKFLFSSLVL